MAGESTQREFERRHERRRRFLRSRRGRTLGLAIVALYFAIGALVPMLPALMTGHGEVRFGVFSLLLGTIMAAGGAVQLFAAPQSETAWRRGAEGERIVGRALDALEADGVRSLHDLRMPGSRANIDHIAVTPRGVFTVDAKRYAGKLETRRGRELWVAGRNRSKLLDQARRQATAVATLLRADGRDDLDVHPALCFVETQLPWFFAPTSIDGVLIATPRKLKRHVVGQNPPKLSPRQVTAVADLLESSLSPAMPPTVGHAAPPPAGGNRSESADRPAHADTGTAPHPARASAPPTCRCGQSMVRRVRRTDQRPFYGCSTFPQCRHTRDIPLSG